MDPQDDKQKQKVIKQVEKLVRYYSNQYPRQGELVVVQCTSCEENGCYVDLLEYERKKGMIPLNEYTTSMKKNMHRAMKVGKVEVVRVTKVDTNKGYIDLSKSKVLPEEEKQGNDKFAKTKMIHSIIVNITNDQSQISKIYKQIVWPLYEKYPTVHPLDFIKQILLKQDRAEELGFTDPKLRQALIEELKRRFKRPIIKSIAIFKVSVESFDGILKIKKILQAGADASKEKEFNVKITILGAPDYLCEISTPTKEEGEEALMLTLNKIRQQTEKIRGEFLIKQKPKVVGDTTRPIHEIYAEEMDENDQLDDEDQMGDQDDQ